MSSSWLFRQLWISQLRTYFIEQEIGGNLWLTLFWPMKISCWSVKCLWWAHHQDESLKELQHRLFKLGVSSHLLLIHFVFAIAFLLKHWKHFYFFFSNSAVFKCPDGNDFDLCRAVGGELFNAVFPSMFLQKLILSNRTCTCYWMKIHNKQGWIYTATQYCKQNHCLKKIIKGYLTLKIFV